MSFGLGLAIIALLLNRLDINVAQALRAIGQADGRLVLLAVGLYYTTFLARGLRWQVMLRNAGLTPPPSLFLGLVVFLSWFANCLVPAKLGDVYRAYLLKKHRNISASFAGGTIIAERLIDLSFVLLLSGAAVLIIFPSRVPDGVVPVLVVSGVAVLGAGVALLSLRRWEAAIARFLPRRARGIFDRFRGGTVAAFGSYPSLAVLTVLAWAAEIARFWLVAHSLALFDAEPMVQQIAIATFVALGSAIFTTAAPTPGGLGAAELAIVGALALTGRVGEIAVGAALLDRLISYWSLIALGLIPFLAWEIRSAPVLAVAGVSRAHRD
ncbi:MAG: flippase-like domain-containing protein [Chloroflexi bacterium]|nr:flippase-like domain-containing protein [Chloroflexota bacterium]